MLTKSSTKRRTASHPHLCVCAAQVDVSEEGSTWGVERLLHVP